MTVRRFKFPDPARQILGRKRAGVLPGGKEYPMWQAASLDGAVGRG